MSGISPVGAIGRVTRAGAIRPDREATEREQEAEARGEAPGHAGPQYVDNLTVLNGARGMSEILDQVIGQAGPALDLAKQTLGVRENGGDKPQRPGRGGNGHGPAEPHS